MLVLVLVFRPYQVPVKSCKLQRIVYTNQPHSTEREMTMRNALTVTALAIALAGCVAIPGAQEAATPPRLTNNNGGLIWDNPGYFGPVPAALTEKGAATCATLNKDGVKYSAKGFHSKGQDVNGKAFPLGAFYCVRD